MPDNKLTYLGVVLLAQLLMSVQFGDVFAVDVATTVSSNLVGVSTEIIKAKLKEVEASKELDETAKSSLIELYRKALSNLEAERANKKAANAFIQARKTAPEEAKLAREKLEQHKKKHPTVTLEVSEKTPLADVEQLLLNEKANQTAVEAKLAEFEKHLATESERPTIVRQRITDSRTRQEEINKALKAEALPDELPQLFEAKRLSLKTEQLALSAELKMLDQELLSQPMRITLLKVQLERTERSSHRMTKKISLLEELVSQRRRMEAEQARLEAEAVRVELANKHPFIQDLAKQNAVLTDRLTQLSAELEKVSTGDQQADNKAKRIEEELRSTRQKLEVAGLSQVLGLVLLEQRRLLPDARSIRRKAKAREALIAAAALRQIQDNEELKRLRNINTYVESLTSGLDTHEATIIQLDLKELAKKRRDLLGKAISLNEAYLRALGELDFAQNRLIDAVESYDTFLAENLLWIRSAPPPNVAMMLEIPEQIYELLALHRWFEVGYALISRATQSPVLVLVLVAIVVLLLKSRRMREMIVLTGKSTIKVRSDKFSYTLQALVLTILLAVPWPLFAGVMGWQLSISLEATKFIKALSHALLVLAPAYFYLKAFRIMCLSGGLAEAHFRWPKNSTKALRRQLRILMVTFLPAGLIAIITIRAGSAEYGGGLGRVAFVMLVLALSYFFYRLFGPNQITLQDIINQHPHSVLGRFRLLWLVLALLLPAFLVVLAVSGYLYTAGVLTGSLIDTLWLLLGVIVIHQLAIRWLLLARRKLALEAAIERRKAALEAAEVTEEQTSDIESAESSQYQVDEPEIDLFALNEESRKLLNTALPLFSLICLWFIWSDVLPAFGLLNDISIWHYQRTISGEHQIVPVTLADLLLAVIIIIVTVVAAKHFPALLEIILLQRFSISSGGRYAVTTLSRYTIAALGVVFALNTLGASWTQVQWLVAALGVGIGFGLQEIVANFISGLIILFERPIRVGDVVTIGNTDGVVTRIQIRATTIRTWDRLELLVPNKEFITGRLLNWSLSDQTTRLKVPVGIAYGSNVQQAMSLMNQTAEENEAVLSDPPPSIIFEAFGDNSLNLVLRCFVGTQDDRMPTLTALHETINQKFSQAGIVIAYPQRDVHLDTRNPLEVRISANDSIETRKFPS